MKELDDAIEQAEAAAVEARIQDSFDYRWDRVEGILQGAIAALRTAKREARVIEREADRSPP